MLAGHPLVSWCSFAAIVAALLALELGVISRGRLPSLREPVRWSLVVIGFAALFCGVLWLAEGPNPALQFTTAYIVELSLSVDNLLVFIIVFEYFAVPVALQPTVLKWGILGAIVMRGVMIGAGTLMLAEFSWVLYVLGALLIITGIKLLSHASTLQVDVARNPLLRLARRVLPVSGQFAGTRFVVRDGVRTLATPLLLVLLVIEWTDLVFATDSIPAIFAITRDPFLVYTSNILAVIVLRALFFVLAAAMARFHHLRFGVAAVLVFVGGKMLVARWVVLPTGVVLGVVVLLLAASIGASAAKERP